MMCCIMLYLSLEFLLSFQKFIFPWVDGSDHSSHWIVYQLGLNIDNPPSPVFCVLILQCILMTAFSQLCII